MAAPNHEQITQLAYELWVRRGSPVGSPEVDWSEAEAQFRSATVEGHSGDRPPATRPLNKSGAQSDAPKPTTVRTDELFNDEDTPVPLAPALTNFE